ncbi:MAG: DDE-type integrase/transposase/recombinase [Sulfitobacter sp.]
MRRLMGLMGLQAIYKGLNTNKKRHLPISARKLPITRPNHVWCSDITYTPVRRGFLYLVTVMDWATRKVMARRLSNTLDAGFCVEALNEAIAKYDKPEITSTDRGSQFTGAAWITTLTEADVKVSMDGLVRYLFSHASPMRCRAMGNIFIERLLRLTCAPKTPPDLCRVRPTKGRTNEGTIYGRADHCDDQGTGSWREDR